jgi:hypothetical protein
LLFVSWLLVAFIPGLLMLATFGLERLEAGLAKNTLTASDVAEFLEQAEPIDVSTLAREGMPQALDRMHRRIGLLTDEPTQRPSGPEATTDRSLMAAVISAGNQPGFSRQPHNHSRTNPQFEPPRYANRV